MAEGAPDLRRGLWRGLLSSALGLGAVLLALFVVSRTDLGRGALDDLASRARWEYVALASLLMSAAFVFMGLRWRSLMPPGHRPPALGLTAMLLAGLLLNYAFPGPMGELGAAWFAHRRYGVPMADSLASGVGARLIGLATSALIAVLVWALADLPVPEGYGGWVAAAALVIGVGGVLLGALAALPRVWQRVASRIFGLFQRPPALRRLAERGARLVVTLTEAMAGVVARGPAAYARTAAWAVCGHLTVTAGIAVAAAAFGVSPDPAGLLFTYTLTTAGAVALFAFPGSQLSWDAGFVALLVAACGLALPDALAVAAVIRLQQVLLQGIGGVAMGWLLATGGAPPPELGGCQAPGTEA